MKKQLMHIHGGTSWPTEDSFLKSLHTKDISEPFVNPDVKKSWHSKYLEFLGDNWGVIKPNMPCADNAKYDAWKIWFERYFEYMRDGIVLVGHSLGGTFLIKYLSENTMPVTVAQVHLVAAACENGDYGEVIFNLSDDWSLMAQQCKDIRVYHSQDDFIVPYKEGVHIADKIKGATLITFVDRGHFLQPEFPELIANIIHI